VVGGLVGALFWGWILEVSVLPTAVGAREPPADGLVGALFWGWISEVSVLPTAVGAREPLAGGLVGALFWGWISEVSVLSSAVGAPAPPSPKTSGESLTFVLDVFLTLDVADWGSGAVIIGAD
jgi:hypothetical protein